jgi:hypothetical protein
LDGLRADGCAPSNEHEAAGLVVEWALWHKHSGISIVSNSPFSRNHFRSAMVLAWRSLNRAGVCRLTGPRCDEAAEAEISICSGSLGTEFSDAMDSLQAKHQDSHGPMFDGHDTASSWRRLGVDGAAPAPDGVCTCPCPCPWHPGEGGRERRRALVADLGSAWARVG